MILVTGSSGFVGQPLIKQILASGGQVKGVARKSCQAIYSPNYQFCPITDFSDSFEWQNLLHDVSIIIHTIARVHIMDDKADDPEEAFKKCNVHATLNLAKQAAAAGIRRFIFISSIKVNGESTIAGKSFLETDKFVPSDPYGLSKYEAEKGLLEIAKETGMEVVIIRPPLVYGPGVKANFLSLMKLLNRGIPLPFGKIENKRSFIALENLVSFIIHCIEHPKAANEVFLISDGEDVSTTQLLRKVAQSLGKKPWLIPVPIGLMKFMAQLVGKTSLSDRLFGSLQVDSSKARDLVGWKPITTMDEQLKKTADAFLK